MKWCPQDCETEARLTKRIAELEALLREADNLVVWEMAMPNGHAFQERVEKALGISKKGAVTGSS